MPNEIGPLDYASGATLWAVLTDGAGLYALGPLLEPFDPAHWAAYGIPLPELTGSNGQYLGDMPALPPGLYTVRAYRQAGAVFTLDDLPEIAVGTIRWGGTAELTPTDGRYLQIRAENRLERHVTEARTYPVEARTYGVGGVAVNADITPTLEARGTLSGDLSGYLGTVTNPAPGIYRWTYTVASGAVLETVRFDLAAILRGTTFTLEAFVRVVDTVVEPLVPAVPGLCQPCPSQCPVVFDRVHVSYLIRGMTRVLWDLLPTFGDPLPLEFQLQAGQSANPDADDWADVGLPVVNVYYAIDPDQHVFGKNNFTHYRVKLTTSLGTYYSAPEAKRGVLGQRDWLNARERVRIKRVVFRYGPSGQMGYLLKRRVTGYVCPVCTDFMTSEVRDPDCPQCYGSGFQCGYFFPMSCVWASLSPVIRRTHLDAGQARGTIDDITVKAEMLQTELLGEADVWVAAKTDERWYVHTVANTAEIRGVPIVADVELRLIPFSSSIYTIPIPDQLVALDTEPF